MKRIRRILIIVIIAASMALPRVAGAESAIDIYNNIADAIGVTIDIAQEVWQNKTKLAYLAYLETHAKNTSNPADLYRNCLRLEEVTGYDIVYTSNDKYYIEHIEDSNASGGAFYGIPIDNRNFSRAYDEYLHWLRYIVNNGPAWPYEGTTPDDGDEPTEDGDYLVYPLIKNYTNGSAGLLLYYGDKAYRVTLYGAAEDDILPLSAKLYLKIRKTMVQSISDNYPHMLITTSITELASTNGGRTSTRFYLTSERNITETTISKYGVDYPDITVKAPKPFYRSQYVYYTYTYENGAGYLTFDNVNLQWETRNSADYNSNNGGLYWMPGYQSGGVVVPPATDNTPPEDEQDIHINVQWPNITLPSLSLQATGGDTVAGDIDFTPVTSRLDTINDNFMLFESSFESMRSDLLQMWDALGHAMDDVSETLWSCEQYLRACRDWLINIYNKPNSRLPDVPDPTDFGDGSTGEDGGGFWDWLGEFLDNLIGELPEGVGNLTSALGSLTGKFPFSVPWDVAFMLGLMSQEPQTPEFDVIQPSVQWQGGQVVFGTDSTIHVDLSEYDEDARLFRACCVMAFCLCLGAHTYQTLRGMDWAIFE